MSVGIGNFVHEGNPYFFAVVEGVVSRACASEQEAQGLRIALEIAFRNVAVYDGDDVSDVVDVEGMPDGWKVWDVRDQEGMLAVQRPDGSLLDRCFKPDELIEQLARIVPGFHASSGFRRG
ncbi:hypothetical protein ABMY26_33425 [Azospirillum sp. HJ39]|uniref:hypothetical protein n=1 Tax=Azospirillum sp. HJ39 TaxID=3159496 RepID=UPI003556AEEE